MAKSNDVSLMNVSAIRLADRHVSEIVDTATHVAIYQFNPRTYQWEKNNAEGALFVYSRNGDPRYSIIVLNRLNTSNLVEPINESIDLQLQEPFLLYKNSKGEIHGVWFYDKEECVRIARTIAKLVSELNNKSSCTMNSQSRSLDSVTYQQAEKPDADSTPKSVKDFFARAGSKAPSQPPGPRPPPPGMQSLSQNIPMIPPGVSPGKQLADVNPLLQRLMASTNPITVEQLEKQQRSSPQDIPKSKNRPSVKKETTPRRPLTLPVQMSPKLENGFTLMNLGDSPPQGLTPSSIPTQHFFNSAVLSHSPSEPLEVSVLEQQAIETPTKPALIPPSLFASSANNEEQPLVVKPEPLTKSQLLQAVTYLLKNDADFINKLHEAYVKSFVDMVS